MKEISKTKRILYRADYGDRMTVNARNVWDLSPTLNSYMAENIGSEIRVTILEGAMTEASKFAFRADFHPDRPIVFIDWTKN